MQHVNNTSESQSNTQFSTQKGFNNWGTVGLVFAATGFGLTLLSRDFTQVKLPYPAILKWTGPAFTAFGLSLVAADHAKLFTSVKETKVVDNTSESEESTDSSEASSEEEGEVSGWNFDSGAVRVKENQADSFHKRLEFKGDQELAVLANDDVIELREREKNRTGRFMSCEGFAAALYGSIETYWFDYCTGAFDHQSFTLINPGREMENMKKNFVFQNLEEKYGDLDPSKLQPLSINHENDWDSEVEALKKELKSYALDEDKRADQLAEEQLQDLRNAVDGLKSDGLLKFMHQHGTKFVTDQELELLTDEAKTHYFTAEAAAYPCQQFVERHASDSDACDRSVAQWLSPTDALHKLQLILAWQQKTGDFNLAKKRTGNTCEALLIDSAKKWTDIRKEVLEMQQTLKTRVEKHFLEGNKDEIAKLDDNRLKHLELAKRLILEKKVKGKGFADAFDLIGRDEFWPLITENNVEDWRKRAVEYTMNMTLSQILEKEPKFLTKDLLTEVEVKKRPQDEWDAAQQLIIKWLNEADQRSLIGTGKRKPALVMVLSEECPWLIPHEAKAALDTLEKAVDKARKLLRSNKKKARKRQEEMIQNHINSLEKTFKVEQDVLKKLMKDTINEAHRVFKTRVSNLQKSEE